MRIDPTTTTWEPFSVMLRTTMNTLGLSASGPSTLLAAWGKDAFGPSDDPSPSIHYKSRLSLSQLCGVQKKPPLQLLSSDQCAPHSFGAESPPLLSGSTASRSGTIAVDRVATAASDGFAVVEAGETLEFVAATAACGWGNHQRASRHVPRTSPVQKKN